MRVEEPFFVEVPDNLGRMREGEGYIKHLNKFPFSDYKIAVVILADSRHKKKVKAHLDRNNIVSQFLLSSTIDRAKITVYSNILKQINAKCKEDLYRLKVDQKMQNTMVVGTASYSNHLTQHYAQVVRQDLLNDLVGKKISKDQQEEQVCQNRADIIVNFILSALNKYLKINKTLPKQIAIYRDGVGGPSYQEKVIRYESSKIEAAVRSV
jgi:ribosomal silencing factor RsfS